MPEVAALGVDAGDEGGEGGGGGVFRGPGAEGEGELGGGMLMVVVVVVCVAVWCLAGECVQLKLAMADREMF